MTQHPRAPRGQTQIDDRVLLLAARDGNTDAFAALVQRHHPAVYRVALRMLASEADAQDATQDTFLRAWRALGRFRADSAISTWLYRIVTRRCLDMIAARPPTQELAAGPAAELAAGPDPAHAAEQHERLRAITIAIAALPGEQRAALVLREFEGLSYEEVAAVLNTTVPAVKGRIHRGRLTVIKLTRDWR